MEMYFAGIILLLLGGVFSLFVKEKNKSKVCVIFSFLGMLAFLPCIAKALFWGSTLNKTLYFGGVLGSVNFVVDPLSAFFVFVISLMTFLGILYGGQYLKHYLNKDMNFSSHHLFLMLLEASMIGVVTVQNALFFLIVWEIMSLSSFFLVIFENNKKEVLNAGIKYLIYMHISVIFIITMFALLSIEAGSLNFADFQTFLKNAPNYANLVFFLGFIGFGIKAGFLPFHNWLPDAHPMAPSHVSGIMSGVMIKTGIYGILRTLLIVGTPTKVIAYAVLIVSVLSALYGVLYAISQHDIKRLLAYHSIENIGIIGIGIGAGLLGVVYNNPIVAILGFGGGILHVLNHSIFKELLFLCAGNVYMKTGTKDVEKLGGLIKKMPYTAVLFMAGSIAICALPPLNGFISEFLIYASMIFGFGIKNIAAFMSLILALAALALIGTMAVLCFTKAFGVIFLGSPREEFNFEIKEDVSKTMLLPIGILAIFTLLIGLFPQFVFLGLINPVSMFLKDGGTFALFAEILNFISQVAFSIFVFLGVCFIVFLVRFLICRKKKNHTTWGCGYNLPNSRMQYTASGYADLFISTLKPMFKRVVHVKKPKDFFPKEAYYEVEIEDIEEAYIVKPLVELDEKFLSGFERLQNGNIQQYILFGLIFLILMIAGLIYLG